MSDDYQVDIPASFEAVHADARRRLTIPLAEFRARYDMCEDLASHLVQQALLLHHSEVPSEPEILLRIHAGLCLPESGLPRAEADWVVRRLAELLNWRSPDLPGPHEPETPRDPSAPPPA